MQAGRGQRVDQPADRLVVLHIGGGKCGSSSIQASLSRQPLLDGPPAARFEYIVWGRDDLLLRGKAISDAAASSIFGYRTAPAVTDAASANRLEGLLARLGGTPDEPIPILSNEGWAPRGRIFAESGLIAKAGVRAHVVLMIRPPIDWLNSAWWQWGAWSGHALEHWVDRSLWQVRWAAMIERWRAVPGVERVSVCPMRDDVLRDFGRLIDARLAPVERLNAGSDRALLRLMQRHPELRPGPHASDVDFVMARLAPPPEARTPWVIPLALAERVLSRLASEHRRLVGLVGGDAASAIEGDARWWDPGSYSDRAVEPAGRVPPVRQEVEDLALRASLGLKRLRPARLGTAPLTGHGPRRGQRDAMLQRVAWQAGTVAPEAEEADSRAVRAILELVAAARG